MTALALKNPIAVLMACIGVAVFAAVVTPRMAVDTFPELTPPVLIIGDKEVMYRPEQEIALARSRIGHPIRL